MNLSPSYFNIAIPFIKNLLTNNHMINVQTESDKFDIIFTNVDGVLKRPEAVNVKTNNYRFIKKTTICSSCVVGLYIYYS